ncbi:transglutaminase-like domain-containing protein [Sanyastnella coralliicola]|uniref:transglutaminase-like domain-containing protein n=1 Tax=Sanyastnella coralliicola TaxID=3069118 RepID=UPI0027B9695C|nr:transglutaminase-like domain-containing protein [Longitalea sp. SCSIO 12813]
MEQKDFSEYLSTTEIIDFQHADFQSYSERWSRGSTTLENAVNIYNFVRDDLMYDPFNIRFEVEKVRISNVVKGDRGHCIDKAMVFIGLCRNEGLPARLGLARVQNHMGTERLEAILQTNVLVPHGYAEVYLEDRWVKCTPAFNKELCDKLGVEPLEFNGTEDSVFQAYDRDGGDFMQYLEDYGGFADLPRELVFDLFQKEYPHLLDDQGQFKSDLLKR